MVAGSSSATARAPLRLQGIGLARILALGVLPASVAAADRHVALWRLRCLLQVRGRYRFAPALACFWVFLPCCRRQKRTTKPSLRLKRRARSPMRLLNSPLRESI